MSKPPVILGIILAIILIAFSFPQIAGTFFLNLANTQIARGVVLPTDAPNRVALLVDADVNLARAQSFSYLPRAVLAAARIALARNDAPRALEILNSSGAPLANDSVVQFTWGETSWRANQPESAFAHWRAGNSLEYFRQQMYRSTYRHEWQDAVNFARIARGVNPGFADAYYVLGDALSWLNVNDTDAVRNLDRVRELTQDKELIAAALSRKGEILTNQNKLRDAIDVFNEARSIAPIDARPRTGYAIASLRLDPDARDQSTALLREVVNDSPWYVSAYIALSNIAEANGQVSDAEMWLDKGMMKNPDDPNLLLALGQFYARQNRIGEARQAMTLALKYEQHGDVLQSIARNLAELPTQ